MPLQFNPNQLKKAKRLAPCDWATYIPNRTTKAQFAVHNQRGNALAALASNYAQDAILYRLVDGNWKEIFRREGLKTERYSPQHVTGVTCHKCGMGPIEHSYVWPKLISKGLEDIEQVYFHSGCRP